MLGGSHARTWTIKVPDWGLLRNPLLLLWLLAPTQGQGDWQIVLTRLPQADDGPSIFLRITLECSVRIHGHGVGDFVEQWQIIQ